MGGILTRWIKKPLIAATFALGLGSAATPAQAFLDSEKAWNDLLQFAVRQINAPGEFEIELGKVVKPEDGFALISSLRIRDSDGVWLDASGLLVDWNPTSLLRGRFWFETLSADEIKVLRAPISRGDPPADEAQVAFAWPRPPVTLIVEKMLIKRMVIAGGLLPQDIEARIEGRFVDRGDVQEATLGVTRLDRPGDSIDLGTRIDFDEMDISVSLEAVEAPGGLVAEIAGLPETEALEITAAASGNPNTLPFTVYADIGQIGVADGSGVASWAKRKAVVFDGTVEPGDKTAGQWRKALGDAARIHIDAEQTDAGAYFLRDFKIDSDAFAFQGKGTVDPEANTIDADFDWAAKDIDALNAVIAPSKIGALSGSAKAKGALNAPKVDVNASVGALKAGFGAANFVNLRIDSAPNTDPTSQTQTFSFEAKAAGLALNDPALQQALGSEPVFKGNGAFYGAENRVAIEKVSMIAASLDLDGNATYDVTTGSVNAELSGAARKLGPFMRAAGIPVDGAAQLALKIQNLTATSVERLFLNAQLSQLSSEDPNYAAIIGETAVLEALLVEADPGVVKIERGFFESATLRTEAKGSFSVEADAVDLALDWRLKDAARIAPVIAPATLGGAQGSAILKGTLSEPKVDVDAVLTDISAQGYAASRATAISSLQLRKDRRAPFSLVSSLEGFKAPDPTLSALVGPTPKIDASGLYDTATSLLSLSASDMVIAAGNLSLDGDVHLAKQTINASYELTSKDLAVIGASAGVDMSGTVDAEGSVNGPFLAPLISTRADVRDLKLYGYAVDALDLDLKTEPATDGDVPFTLDLAATNPSLNDPELDALIGTNPKISAKGTFNPDRKRASLEAFSATLNKITATAAGDVDITNNTMDVTYDLSAEDLSGLAAITGTEIAGALTSKGRASGTFYAPELDATLDGRGLRFDVYSVDSIVGSIDVKQALVGFAPFDVDVVASGVDLGDPALNELIGPRAVIKAKGAYNQLLKAVRFDNAEFDTAAAKGTAAGSVNLTNQTIDMSYDVDVSALEPIGDVAGLDLGGSVVAKGIAKGTFVAPQIDTTIKGRKLRFNQYSVAAVDGTVDIQQSATGFAPFDINVEATGIDLGDPALTDLIGGKASILAEGGFNQTDKVIRLDDLEVTSALARATAKGSVDIDDQSLDVDFALDAKSLARLKPILKTEIAGAIGLSGNAVGTFAEPAISAKIKGSSLRYADYAVTKIDGSIDVKRTGRGFSPFNMDVTADGLDLGDPGLTAALGRSAKIKAKGGFNEAAQKLRLETAQVITGAATIAASGNVDLGGKSLDVGFDLNASDLSPFSAIIGTETTGSLKAKGRAAGSFASPSVDATLSGGGLRYGPYSIAAIDGRVDVDQNPNGFAPFDIDIRASGIDLSDPALTAAVGESATIAAKGRFDQSKKILRLDSATAVTNAATASASGTVDIGNQTLDVAFDLDARALDPLSAIAGQNLSGSLRASGKAVGPFSTPAVATTLTGRGLQYGADAVGAIDGRIDIPRSQDGFAPFSVDVTANGISLGDPSLDALIGDSAVIKANGQIDQLAQIVRLDTAQIGSRALAAGAQGTIDLGNQTLDVSFNVNAADLSPATTLVGTPLGGSLKANGSARGPFAAPILNVDAVGTGLYFDRYSVGQLDLNLAMQGSDQGPAPFTLKASAYGTRLGDPNLEALLGENVTLEAPGTFDQRNLRITLRDATLRARAFAARVGGSVDLKARQVNMGYSAHLNNLGLLQPVVNRPLAGDVRVDGRVSGSFDDPGTRGTLAGSNVLFDSYELTTVTVQYDLQRLISGPLGSTNISAQTPYGPLTADAAFDLTEGAVRIDRLSVNGLGVNLNGQFRSLPGGLYEGNTALEAADLSLVGRFIGQDLAGTANGSVTLSGQNGQQFAAVDLDASGIRFAQNGSVIATVGALDLKGTANDVFGADPYIDGTLFASSAVITGIPIQQINVVARGPLSALDATISGSGGATGSDKLETSGRFNLVRFPRGAQFNTFAASYKGVQVASASQFNVQEVSGGGWRADGLNLRIDDGELVGSGEYSPNGVVAKLGVRNVPLSLLQVVGYDVIQTGRLFGQMNIDTRGTPRGDFSFTANVLRLKGAQLDEPFDFQVDGTLDARAIDITAKVNSAIINDPFVAVARIPLKQVAGVPLPVPDMVAPFTASVDWMGDISEFWAFVPAPDHVLSGPVVINGRASGTLTAPQLTGGLVLSNGRYQNLEFGTLLDEMNAKGDFTQDGRVVFDLTATDAVTGTVAAKGSYTVADGAIDATVNLNQAALVRRDDATVVISGDASAKGPGRGEDIAVRGAFRTNFVELRLIGGFGSSVVVVDAIPVGETAPRYEEPDASGKPQRISLDVSLDFPQQVFVRGRGLESEWGGQIRATGYASNPRVEGLIEKRRGWLDLLGRQFELAIGEVRFNGPLDPFIRIRLQRDANDIVGWLDVTGPASDIEIEFGSIPALSPDEVLPRLLFGRSKQSLSGLEAAQLAAGVATLLSGKAGALDQVRGALGVDVLRVEGGDDGGTSISTGKYLTEDIFVGAKQNLETGQTSAVVEIEVFENFEIQGEFGADDAEASASWKLDY